MTKRWGEKKEQRDTGRERNREASNETGIGRNRGIEIGKVKTLKDSRESQRAHKTTPAEAKTRRTCKEPE